MTQTQTHIKFTTCAEFPVFTFTPLQQHTYCIQPNGMIKEVGDCKLTKLFVINETLHKHCRVSVDTFLQKCATAYTDQYERGDSLSVVI